VLVAATIGSMLTPALADTARPVKGFLDSMGVVSQEQSSSYESKTALAANMQYLGFTIWGDDLKISPAAIDPIMAIPGMRLVALIPYRISNVQNQIINPAKAMLSRWGPKSLFVIRGFNEPNNFQSSYLGRNCGPGGRGRISYAACGQGMKDIYAAVRAESTLDDVIVSGVAEPGASGVDNGLQFTLIPSSHTTSTFRPGTQFSDWIDVHAYPNDNTQWPFCQADVTGASGHCTSNLIANHGPSIWGGGYAGYGLSELPTVPKIATEWGTDSRRGEALQGQIAVSGFLDFHQQGWKAALYFQLRDVPEGSPDLQTDGLFRSNGSPKLAATWLHNQHVILQDTMLDFQPGTLSNSIKGRSNLVHDLLMQKSNGDYYWAVWRESATGSAALTLDFGTTASEIVVYDPTSGTSALSTHASGSTLGVTVTNHPIFVKFSVPAPRRSP
jgi:hypothetical protein